jgi:hypothetical protein
MKHLKLSLISLLMVLGCDKKEDGIDMNINPEYLIATWRLEKVTLNDIDGADINDWINTSTILGIDSDKTYFRNYVHGTWTLDGNTLTLGLGDNTDWDYRILELSNNSLTVEVTLTERRYCCDFSQFEDNEPITIIEKYFKEE